MSAIKRIEVAIGLYIIFSGIVVLNYFFGIGSALVDMFTSGVVVITSFTILIGVYTLARHHIRRIQMRRSGWYYGLIVFACAITLFTLGFVDNTSYQWMQDNVLRTLQMSLLSYVGVYMYTAMFRGARVRSIDAGVLLVVTVIMLVYTMPMGRAIFPIVTPIGDYIKQYIHTGAQRAFVIGLGLGLLALMVRTWLGMERSYLGRA